MDQADDHLKVIWFQEIPRCTFQCLYPEALACGCAYSDYSCICSAIADLTQDAEIEACINACPVNPDQRWAPSRILDFCDLVGEKIRLPHYMNQFASFHRRNAAAADDVASNSDYSYYSTVSADGSQPSATTLATTTVSTTSSPTSTSTSGTSTNGLVPIPTASSPSSLSTGAKAGIGVAVPVAVIIVGLLGWWLWRKRTANEKDATPRIDHNDDIPELGENDQPQKPLPAEADSNALHEFDSNSLDTSKSPVTTGQAPAIYELSGNSVTKKPDSIAGLATRAQNIALDKQVDSSANETSQRVVTGNTSANEGPLASAEQIDMPLSELEAEMALITEEKERVLQLQVLSEREAELNRRIMAHKSVS